MDPFQELMIMAAKTIPFEIQVQTLKRDVDAYLADPTKRNKHKVMVGCVMVGTAGSTEDLSTSQLMEEISKEQAVRDAVKMDAKQAKDN